MRIELINKVDVHQYVNRTASTGRKMFTIEIFIDTTIGGGQLKLKTFWQDMPYRLNLPTLKRIQGLVSEMLQNKVRIEEIQNHLINRYYTGFPKKQNITDWERYLIRKKRQDNRPIRVKKAPRGWITIFQDGKYKSCFASVKRH